MRESKARLSRWAAAPRPHLGRTDFVDEVNRALSSRVIEVRRYRRSIRTTWGALTYDRDRHGAATPITLCCAQSTRL